MVIFACEMSQHTCQNRRERAACRLGICLLMWLLDWSSVDAIMNLSKHYFHYSHTVHNNPENSPAARVSFSAYFGRGCAVWNVKTSSEGQSFFLFSFTNARLSVPALASPEGNKASVLLFGNLSHPHVNNCAGHCVGFIYVHVDCVAMYTTI